MTTVRCTVGGLARSKLETNLTVDLVNSLSWTKSVEAMVIDLLMLKQMEERVALTFFRYSY